MTHSLSGLGTDPTSGDEPGQPVCLPDVRFAPPRSRPTGDATVEAVTLIADVIGYTAMTEEVARRERLAEPR